MRHSGRMAFVSTIAGAAAALAVAAPASASPPTVQLSHSDSPSAATTPKVGTVAGQTTINFEVDLKLADQPGAVALAQAVSTPGSASYGKYLTPAQWEARFSPRAADVSKVKAFLRQSGFTIVGVTADQMAISASGTAAQVEHAFGTSLAYHSVNGRTLRLADTDLSVPANLAGAVAGVTGVSDTLAHPDDSTGALANAPAGSGTLEQPAGFRVAPPCGTYFGQKLDAALPPFGGGYPADPPWAVCGYTGPQFRSAYNLTSADNGAGVTVAIVDAYVSPTLFSDAHEFAAINDPSNPLAASQFSELLSPSFDLTSPLQCGATGWYGEQTLDVEAVHNTAPGANILAAGAKNCENPQLDLMLHKIVDGHLASVITNSYGDDAGDVLDSAEDRSSTDNILLMAAGTGVSVLFSSGDGGDEFTTVGDAVPDYPASSPWVTAVGGTTLEIGATGQRTGEYGWSTARSFLCNETYVSAGGCEKSQLGTWRPIDEALDGGSGGGTSFVYPQPAYQQGVVPTSLSERHASLLGPTPMRVEPDISMEADPATGMLVGETQKFPNGTFYDQYRIGGTSVASPLFAGVVARADETAGSSIGFLNPKLYSLYGNSSAIYDVQPGAPQDQSRADYANSIDPSDGFLYSTRIIDYEGQEQFCNADNVCKTRNVALSTAPGFDSMTGLGAPTGDFVQALAAP
jgi:subtilase family serine protease